MQKFLNYILIFLIVLLGLQILLPKPDKELNGSQDDLTITSQKEFSLSKTITVALTNNTQETLTLPSDCPAEPFNVLKQENGEWLAQNAVATMKHCLTDPLVLAPGAKAPVSYQPWQDKIFTEPGKYKIQIPVTINGNEKKFEHEFEITTPGFFSRIWREIFYRPIYNALIFLTKITGSSFGWGIVLLTLVIRIILVVPFQRAMRSQREMQKIQPELDRLKEKHKGNQSVLAAETMALFKQHKVNPLGSCLPILIQMPFLFAVFWIVQGGLGENNFILLYDVLRNFDFSTVKTGFFGLDLLRPNIYVLPVVVGLLQFGQMRLSMSRIKKQNSAQQTKPTDNPMADVMKNMTKYMQYFLPVMIAVFTVTMPSAVGLYWGTSTLFGIGQQLFVNRQIK